MKFELKVEKFIVQYLFQMRCSSWMINIPSVFLAGRDEFVDLRMFYEARLIENLFHNQIGSYTN